MADVNTYEDFHKGYKTHKRVIKENNFTYKNILRILNKIDNRRKKVLDIGCGTGTLAFYIAKNGGVVKGVDISTNAIRAASVNSAYLNLQNKVTLKRLDISKEKITGKYDLVILSEVLEHLKNDMMVINKISRLLDSKGELLITVPSINAPLYKMGLLSKFDKKVGHLRRYSLNEIVGKLESRSFRIKEIMLTEGVLRNFLFTNKYAGLGIRFIKGWLSNAVSTADNIAVKLFGESQIIVVASKK